MMTPPIEAHVNTQPGSVGKDTQRTRKDILGVLPKDLTKEQVDTVRKTVKVAVMNGYVFDRAERRRLLKCEFAERYKEIIRTMDDKVASEINDRMIEELDKAQEQWVQSDFEGIEYESEEDFDQHEGDYSPLEAVTPLIRKTTTNAETPDRQERSRSLSEEKDETCIASYYPMVEIFKTEESMMEAYEKTRRPGETIEIESQPFSSPERAVGAIQVRHPDFVREE
jgi:hypothetical protein